MKKPSVLILLLTSTLASANPHFTIGSNPFYTYTAYPHDILRWPGKGVFTFLHPQTLPWQGHVTNISERPNDTYISNYNSIEFPVPYDYTGDPAAVRSYMEVSSFAYNNRYTLGGIWDFDAWGRAYLELGTTRVHLEQTVEGVVRNSPPWS